jgi:DNA-binding MarR family transcriptional regulator
MRDRDLDLRLICQLWWLNDTSLRGLEATLEDHVGCSLAQFKLLYATISPDTNLTTKDVARRLGCSTANVSKTLKAMERSDLVAKFPNRRDARSHALRLTTGGLVAYRECVDGIAAEAKQLFGGLDEEEKGRLETLLAKVAKGVSGGER